MFLDPIVHGVAGHQFGLPDLQQHLPLEVGVEIAQEEILAGPVMFGEVGPKVGQDVQLGVEGLAVVEVISVLAGPAEGLARQDLQSRQVDVSGLQQGDVLLSEVVPDGRHHPDLGEVGGGDTEIGRRPAQRLCHLAEGGLHGVVGDRTDYRNGTHAVFSISPGTFPRWAPDGGVPRLEWPLDR